MKSKVRRKINRKRSVTSFTRVFEIIATKYTRVTSGKYFLKNWILLIKPIGGSDATDINGGMGNFVLLQNQGTEGYPWSLVSQIALRERLHLVVKWAYHQIAYVCNRTTKIISLPSAICSCTPILTKRSE